MRHFTMLVCFAVLFASMCGCGRKSTPGDRAEDEQKVYELETAASEAIAAKDLGTLISLYADDAHLYDERNPGIRGKEAIREAWQADFARPGLEINTRPRDVEISGSGDLAWAHGALRMTRNDASGGINTDRYEYAQVYTKQRDGKWKIMADNMHFGLRSLLFPRPPEKRSPNAALAPLIGLACFACGIWFLFGMPVVTIVSAWRLCRSRKVTTGFIVSIVMLIAFFVAAGLIWSYSKAHFWNLPFVDALRAAGDTARYGNPVEDTAEDILVMLLVLSTLSAVAAGVITGVARRRRSQKH
jgi:uncharacterized protein (TIGR02246 family)